ncbi:MAG: hypothetical protein AAF629_02620 [Chloroflexota bacterium]
MLKLISGLLVGVFIVFVMGCTVDVPQAAVEADNEESVDHAESSSTATEEDEETSMEENAEADADVLFVQATQSRNGTWRFNVTVEHPDTGWQDYADGWDVVLPDDTVVKANTDDPFTRLLLHPHETEQPFTRSQSNLTIPEEVTQVTVRAQDLVDGWGGQVSVVDLTKDSGEGFEVSR